MRIVSELPGLSGDRPVHRIGGSDLCDLWGISPAALTALGKREIAIRLGHDAYDLVESTRRYIASLRSVASGRGSEEQASNLTTERAWGDILRGIRSRILAVPSRLRQTVPHLTTSDVTLIDRELRDALQELGAGGQADAND